MWYLPKARALITPFILWKQLNIIKICFVLLPFMALTVSKEKLNSSAVSSLIYLPKQFFCITLWMQELPNGLNGLELSCKMWFKVFFLQNLKTLWDCGDFTYPISHQGLGGLELAALKIWYNQKLLWAAFCWCNLSCSLALTSLSPDEAVSLLCFSDTTLCLVHHHELTAFLCHWRFSCLSNLPHSTVDNEVRKVYV